MQIQDGFIRFAAIYTEDYSSRCFRMRWILLKVKISNLQFCVFAFFPFDVQAQCVIEAMDLGIVGEACSTGVLQVGEKINAEGIGLSSASIECTQRLCSCPANPWHQDPHCVGYHSLLQQKETQHQHQRFQSAIHWAQFQLERPVRPFKISQLELLLCHLKNQSCQNTLSPSNWAAHVIL